MRNLLIDELPRSVTVDGERYGISWGFRTSLLFEMLMQDPDYTDEEKLCQAMELYYPETMPTDMGKGLQAALEFYQCGEEETSDSEIQRLRKRSPVYSFEQDAPYIYAAFLEQYGIDLNAIESKDLHWWKFSALFHSLGEDRKISRIMYYRDVELKGKSKSEQKFLSEMKQRYALRKKTGAQQISLERRNEQLKAYVQKRYQGAG